jgi:hypothetical protein
LRQEFCRHERADLDFTLIRRVGVANPFDLASGGECASDALQAVAQTDFAHDDVRG